MDAEQLAHVIWEALKEVCASTKDKEQVHNLVMVRKQHVEKAAKIMLDKGF